MIIHHLHQAGFTLEIEKYELKDISLFHNRENKENDDIFLTF